MPIPNVKIAMNGWDREAAFEVIEKKVVDYQQTEVERRDKTFRGILQPLPPQKVNIKPEGQRNWKWWMLWTATALDLSGMVKDGSGRVFRVMEQTDYSDGGYFRYHLAEGPQP